MSTLIEDRRSSPANMVKCTWDTLHRTYRSRVILCPEEDGGYSAFAKRLPGVVSQGDTVDEALANIAEAFQGAVSVYVDDGTGIPWQDIDLTDIPNGSVERWIVVDV